MKNIDFQKDTKFNKLGEYIIDDILGEGGMGKVYLVHKVNMKTLYAAKVAYSYCEKELLSKEKDVLSIVNSRKIPYLVDYFKFKDENNMLDCEVMVYEYIRGESFSEYLKRNVPLAEKKAISFTLQIAELIAELHNNNPAVLYLDLKPDNLIMQEDGKLRLIDFGASIIGYGNIKTNVFIGTYGYASPEQIGGKMVNKKSDIYSIGAILYYMLTGNDPAKPPYLIGITRNQMSYGSDILSKRILKILRQCCAEKEEDRYHSVALLLNEINKIKMKKKHNIIRMIWGYYGILLFVIVYVYSYLVEKMICIDLVSNNRIIDIYNSFSVFLNLHFSPWNSIEILTLFFGIIVLSRLLYLCYMDRRCYVRCRVESILCMDGKWDKIDEISSINIGMKK